ncbi:MULTISPECIES: YueI family protein [Bacillaceae]|uniref:YueI family protein n=1 Tax=Bacillaceae TaxID=186817 RepID=UPI000B9B4E25|nr:MULTISPECIES: YueI family protein [Bacillus]MCA1037195.1 YueI family protein [Bacillus infantis]MCK6207321.1 YueI family protein [Bacillus infantis]MDW2878784.1 YueI family protein [Bacillus infantis]OXT15382.1 hypothetical protein B9K06_21225 [Bacillus sp. OG2]
MPQNVDDYVKQGMYGQKQTKPDERRKFLGTIRERVVIALTQPQVRREGTHREVEAALKENPSAHLYLNGNMNYSYLSKYIKLASKFGVEYTIVTNKEHNTEIGLVLAYDHAIDKEEIYISSDKAGKEAPEKKAKKGVAGFLKKFFKGN